MSAMTFLFVALAGGVGAGAPVWLGPGGPRPPKTWGGPPGGQHRHQVVKV